MKRSLFFILCVLLRSSIFAQAPLSWSSAEMFQALNKLNVLGSVLYIAAHPDDENTRLITWLSNDKLYRTGYLSLTRGDGGQNLIGNEQGIDLGLIRTQELLSARRIDGGEQFFTRAYDFGFSTNPTETFNKWNREMILSDVVWVIRKFQPDVIITRFPTTGEGGHGHHTASAILANEAFSAAADPKRFPEQLKYVQPWQAKRILFNGFNFNGTVPNDNGALKVDVGGYNPLLGRSYGEIAGQSRSQHKSQGFGVALSRGESFESFTTTGGSKPDNDLLDGINQTWQRVRGGERIQSMIDSIVKAFDLLHPEKAVPSLVRLHQSLSAMPSSYWQTQKLKEIKLLIGQCSGLFLDATTNTQFAVQNNQVAITCVANNRLGTNAIINKISIDNYDSTLSVVMTKNRNISITKQINVEDKPVTQPYWLANKMEEASYVVKDQLLIGLPDVQPSYTANFTITINGVPFVFERKVQYRFTDPVKGELYEPLVIIPPVELKFADENILSINDSNALATLNYYSNTPASINYDFNYHFSDNWRSTAPSFKATPGTSSSASSYLRPRSKAQNSKEVITIDALGRDKDIYHQYRQTIHYDHIPYIVYFKEARSNLISLNFSIYGRKVGYIPGAGDKVAEALTQMGYDVTILTEKELGRLNLGQFDAIVTGVRAYNTNEWMNEYYDKLMTYVKDGGNLIVQYNTSTNIGPIKASIAPYKFNISRKRVTDENAEVSFTNPAHPVLNFPNKITADDFKGWIQERSIYHATEWDQNFETVISMHDPGDGGDEGSLITAKYGKGVFTYTGLVFFRELPAGVPGAYRLMANLIALNKKKAF